MSKKLLAAICGIMLAVTLVFNVDVKAEDNADDSYFGWKTEDGVEFWYENGVKQGTEGRGKEIYDPGSDAWYWLDAIDGGKKAVSKDVYQESKADDNGTMGKWVRYDANGHMIKGWDENANGRYYFDLTYGTMAKGEVIIDGVSYYFDEVTGICQSIDTNKNGWYVENGIEFWYEYGIKQGTEGRGKEIYDPGSDAWYWLDAIDGGKKAVSKDVYQESKADDAGNIGKWVRYDANGHMIKGWDENSNGRYYFDLVYGTMAKGRVYIDGKSYIFNENTGILEGEVSICNLPEYSSFYKYEYAYRTGDLSQITEENMPFYEGVKGYLDYALSFDTPYLQAKAIHDYMCWNNEYDYTYSKYYEWDVIVDHTSVCNGYMLTYRMFMDMLGIECKNIISRDLDHGWNQIKLDGEWYEVDVTWDDYSNDVDKVPWYGFFCVPWWFSHYDVDDYEKEATGTKWLGEVTYYLSKDDPDFDYKINEVLRTEVKNLSKNRIVSFYIEGEYEYNFNNPLYDAFEVQNYWNTDANGKDVSELKYISKYNSYADFCAQSQKATDIVNKKVNYDDVVNDISGALIEDLLSENLQTNYYFYVNLNGATKTDEDINELVNSIYATDKRLLAYQIEGICSETFDEDTETYVYNKLVIVARPRANNYQEALKKVFASYYNNDTDGYVVYFLDEIDSVDEMEEIIKEAAGDYSSVKDIKLIVKPGDDTAYQTLKTLLTGKYAEIYNQSYLYASSLYTGAGYYETTGYSYYTLRGKFNEKSEYEDFLNNKYFILTEADALSKIVEILGNEDNIHYGAEYVFKIKSGDGRTWASDEMYNLLDNISSEIKCYYYSAWDYSSNIVGDYLRISYYTYNNLKTYMAKVSDDAESTRLAVIQLYEDKEVDSSGNKLPNKVLITYTNDTGTTVDLYNSLYQALKLYKSYEGYYITCGICEIEGDTITTLLSISNSN